MDYEALKEDVTSYLARGAEPANVDTFVRQAEADISRLLKHTRLFEGKDEEYIVDSEQQAPPADFSRIVAWRHEDGVTIEEVNIDFFNSLVIKEGKPRFVNIQASNFVFNPIPTKEFTTTLLYRRKLPPLLNNGDTNFVLEEHYDLYLNLVLWKAFIRFRDTENQQRYEAESMRIAESIIQDDYKDTSERRIRVRGTSTP